MATQYTDQQRTRVVNRSSLTGTTENNPSIGNTQLIEKEDTKLFDGISIAQIVAGAAAAATSMALSSKIGIGGSVIGAAISSVVTVISSQLYRHFLSAGARKVKRGYEAVQQASHAHDAATTAEVTTPLDTGGAAGTVRGARVAPAKLQARAAAERASSQRKVVAFSVIIAVAAVVICTAAILLGTAGEGIGTKTEPILPSFQTSAVEDDGAVTGTAPTTVQTPAAPTADEGAAESGTTDTTTDGATTSTTPSGTTDGSTSTGSDTTGGGSQSTQQPEDGSTDTSGSTSSGQQGDASGSTSSGTTASGGTAAVGGIRQDTTGTTGAGA